MIRWRQYQSPAIFGAAAAGGGASLALDSNAHTNSTVISPTVTLSTSGTNRVILLFIVTNGGPITGVSDGAGLTWTKSYSTMTDGATGSQDFELWWAPAAAQLSADVITASCTSGVFNTLEAIAISGATSISSPFDGSVSHAFGGGVSDPLSITTTATNTIVVAGFRMGSTASPTAGSGFTQISGADFELTEYKTLSSAQTLSCTIGTGVGDANGGLVVAIK